jgi:hypothetical protein
MLAWPAKGKLVKLAKACFPRPRTEQLFGRGNDKHSGDPGCRPDKAVADLPRLPCSLIPGTSIRFVRVRSYDRPDRSIVTVLLDTSM